MPPSSRKYYIALGLLGFLLAAGWFFSLIPKPQQAVEHSAKVPSAGEVYSGRKDDPPFGAPRSLTVSLPLLGEVTGVKWL